MSQASLTIGRFAQLTGLTIRALRLYDEQGLLRPETVDSSSRYRRYSAAQLEQGGLIARLRGIDMPLEEIRRFLDASDLECEQAVLLGHRERLAGRATVTAEAMHALDDMMKELSMPDHRPHQLTAMVLETLRDQPVLRIRRTVEAADCDPGSDIDEAFAAVNRQGLVQAGPPYFSAAEPDDDGLRRIESGIPVDRAGAAEGDVEPGILPGGEAASLSYRGPYPGIEIAYRQLWKEMAAANLTPAGEPRDSYLTSPEATPDPGDYLTEVIWPVVS